MTGRSAEGQGSEAGGMWVQSKDRSTAPGLLHSPGMKLTGDAEGLAALKSFQEGNREYLKFLIQEATSVFEHHVDFKGPDGTQFRLVHDVRTGEFRVEKKAT